MPSDKPSLWERAKRFSLVTGAINAAHSIFWIAFNWTFVAAMIGGTFAAVSGWYHPAATYPVVAGLLAFFSILGISRELKARATVALPLPDAESRVVDVHGIPVPVRKYTASDKERLPDALSGILDVLEGTGIEINRAESALEEKFGWRSMQWVTGADAEIVQLEKLCEDLRVSLYNLTRKYPIYIEEFSYVLIRVPGAVPENEKLEIECNQLRQVISHLAIVLTSTPQIQQTSLRHLALAEYNNFVLAHRQFAEWRDHSKRRALTMREKVMAA